MDLTYMLNCFVYSLNFILRYEFFTKNSQVVDFITQMTERHRDRALKIKESGVPADFFCKIPFLTKGDIAYKLKKIYSHDSKFVFDENSKNGGKFMRNFVENNMVITQTYNEVIMVGVKKKSNNQTLVHSVGIIVREMKGGRQVLFFDQDYERKLFVVGTNTLDYVPVNYEKLFDAYTRIELYTLFGKKV